MAKLERGDLPKVTLTRDVINFSEECIDPAVALVFDEALDYAIETSLSRLNSLSKVFPKVGRQGMGALGAVESIRNAILELPECESEDEPLGKVMPTPPKPEIPATTTKKRKEWGPSYYVDREGKRHGPYSSPTALSRELGAEETKGASDMIEHFTRLGCAVTANGEGLPEMGKDPLIVRWQKGCELPGTVPKPPEVVEKKEVQRFVSNPVKAMIGDKTYMTDDQSRLLKKETDGWVVAKPIRYLVKGKVTETAPTPQKERPVVAPAERVKEPVSSMITAEIWDATTVEGRVGLAKFRGLPGTAASKAWADLTAAEIAQLQGG